jgi:hypothetical protein
MEGQKKYYRGVSYLRVVGWLLIALNSALLLTGRPAITGDPKMYLGVVIGLAMLWKAWDQKRRLDSQRGAAPSSADLSAREGASGERRKCPQCAESIKSEALVCHFCGYDMAPLLAEEAAAREEQLRVLAAQSREREDLRTRALEKQRTEREAWKSSHPHMGWVPVRNNVQAALVAGVLVCLVGAGVMFAATLSAQSAAEEALLRPLQGTWSGEDVMGSGSTDSTTVHSTLVIAGKSIHEVTTYEPQSDMWQNEDEVWQITRVEASTSEYTTVFTDHAGSFAVWGPGTTSAQIRYNQFFGGEYSRQ